MKQYIQQQFGMTSSLTTLWPWFSCSDDHAGAVCIKFIHIQTSCLAFNIYLKKKVVFEISVFNISVPGPVQFFEARLRSSNSFSLYWIPPATEDENGDIQGYDISYQTGEWLWNYFWWFKWIFSGHLVVRGASFGSFLYCSMFPLARNFFTCC